MARKPSYPYPAPSTVDPEEVKRTKAVLKQDDWIGPKTTQAFAQVLRQEDAD